MQTTNHIAQDKAFSEAKEPAVSLQAVLEKQLQLLFAQAPISYAITLLNSFLISVVLWPISDPVWVATWLACMFIVTGLRWGLVLRYRRDPQARPTSHWLNMARLGALLAGLLWGITGSLLFPWQHNVQQMLILATIAGMTAGAVPVLALAPRLYAYFALPAVLPLILNLIGSQQQLYLFLAIMVSAYLLFILRGANEMSETVARSIRYRFSNDALINELSTSSQALQESNEQLQQEVKERKITERRLRSNSQFLEKITNSASDAIFVLDMGGHFVHSNPVLPRLLGVSMEKILETPMHKLLDETGRGTLIETLKKVAQSHQASAQLEGTLQGATGPIHIQYNLSPIMEDETVTAFVGLAKDVTESKQVEKMKSEFVSVVNHELRTPVTSILGSIGLLRGVAGSLNKEQQKELLDTAYHNTERLLELINDLLDIQKLDAGHMSIQEEEIVLTDIIVESIKMNEGLSARFNVGFELKQPLADVIIRADRGRLLQVLTNLYSNAAKFSPEKSNVEIESEIQNQQVIIRVIDRGQGIPEELKPRLFEKFTQGDSSSSRRQSGTGLGLHIVKTFTERMGGSIAYHSRPGHTVFELRFPCHSR